MNENDWTKNKWISKGMAKIVNEEWRKSAEEKNVNEKEKWRNKYEWMKKEEWRIEWMDNEEMKKKN